MLVIARISGNGMFGCPTEDEAIRSSQSSSTGAASSGSSPIMQAFGNCFPRVEIMYC